MPDSSQDLRPNDDSAPCPVGRLDVLRRQCLEREFNGPGNYESFARSQRGKRESFSWRNRWIGASSDDPAVNFALDRSATDGTVARNLLATMDHNRPPCSSDAGGHAPVGSHESAANFGDGVLQPGAELAGFRIMLELGRGAFARVYLAEELNLGRRLVAIKVSRPDGDEPRILARLQHAHIVPVHSVA